MKRRLGIILAIVGAVAMVLGALSATVWRASNQVTMTAPAPTSPVVVSDPGVLAMLDGEVEVTAVAASEEGPVELVIAPQADIEAWLAGSPHQRLTGAHTWEALEAVENPAAEGATETVPSLQEVDGWPTLEAGTGEVTATVTPGEIETGLIAITDGTEPGPEVSLTWQREVGTPWLWPGVIGGALVLAVGVFLLVQEGKERRAKEARRTRRRSATDETTLLPALDGAAAGSDGAPVLSRRARRVAAQQQKRGDGMRIVGKGEPKEDGR